MSKRTNSSITKRYLYFLIGILLLGITSQLFYKRFDLTQDKRYTLSDVAVQLLDSLSSPMEIEVLLSGNSTSEFRRLQQESLQILEELSSVNDNIHYRFIDPRELDVRSDLQEKLRNFQVRPAQIQIKQEGKTQTEVVYPYAFATYEGTSVSIPLLKNQMGASSEERIHHSVQNLEYSFVDSFSRLLRPKHKRIAFLKGNEEVDDKYIADFLISLKEYYFIAPYTLHTTENPTDILTELNTYDLLVVAGPKKAFSETHKHIIDQYLMQGGNILWLGSMNKQELHPDTQETYIIAKDLQITDMFFKYGIRINTNVVKDLYSAPIVIASGHERDTQYDRYPWFFYPLVHSESTHPITTNIDAVKFDYASSIDTLPNLTKKTILLATSPLSNLLGLPYPLDLNREITENLEIINEGPSQANFGYEPLTLAVLLEGPIESAYHNRIKPIKWEDWEEIANTQEGKLLVVSNESVIMNQMDGERPLELGFDKWTNSFYGNKEFLLNSVNYMLDDIGLISLRSKTIAIPFLDIQRSIEQRRMWQYINLLVPLISLGILGLLIRFVRRRKYILKNQSSQINQ